MHLSVVAESIGAEDLHMPTKEPYRSFKGTLQHPIDPLKDPKQQIPQRNRTDPLGCYEVKGTIGVYGVFFSFLCLL